MVNVDLNFLLREIDEYNDMTPRDAIEELESWDLLEIFGDDAESASDAFKRIKVLIFELEQIKKHRGSPVVVTCYGKTRTWETRDAAEKFYTECYFGSEGSEQRRYANILSELKLGKEICTDGEEI